MAEAQKRILIGIGGPTASGKTSIAVAIAEKYNGMRVKFSDILIEEAKQKNVPINKPALQNLWLEHSKSAGVNYLEPLMRDRILATSTPFVVVEGNRFVADIQFLMGLGAEKSFDARFLYVDAPSALRFERYNQRETALGNAPITYAQFEAMENHPTELEMPELKKFIEAHGASMDTGTLPREETIQKAFDLLRLS